MDEKISSGDVVWLINVSFLRVSEQYYLERSEEKLFIDIAEAIILLHHEHLRDIFLGFSQGKSTNRFTLRMLAE